MCLYPSSDLVQVVRALASLWPSFSYVVSGTFLLKPPNQHLTRLDTRVVQEGPSAGLGSGAEAPGMAKLTLDVCLPSCHPHHIWIFSLWRMKILITRKKIRMDKKEKICHTVQQRFALGLVLLSTAKDLGEGRQSV